jgi:hypothetical protein
MTTPLPPIDPSATDDKLPGEAELAALYRQLPQNEPGPALDAAVLQAAARALDEGDESQTERRTGPRESGDWVHPKSRSATSSRATPSIGSGSHSRRRHVPHWLVALGSAASLVLVAGLAWHMRALPTSDTETAAATDAAGAMQASAPATPPDAPETSQARQSALTRSAETQDLAPMPTKKRANHLPPAALPGLKPIAHGAPAPAAAPYKLSDKPLTHDDAATMDATRRAVLEKRAASAPKQAAAEFTAAPSPPPAMEVSLSAPPPSPASKDNSTAAHPDDTPAQELAKIELLVQQHHEAEARRRLQAFRAAHPQWDLPENLRRLSGEP